MMERYCIGCDPGGCAGTGGGKPHVFAWYDGALWWVAAVGCVTDFDCLLSAIKAEESCLADTLVIESGYVGENPKVALDLERGRGHIEACGELAGLDVRFAAWTEWVEMLAVSGRAPKTHEEMAPLAKLVASEIIGEPITDLAKRCSSKAVKVNVEDAAVAVCLADWGDRMWREWQNEH